MRPKKGIRKSRKPIAKVSKSKRAERREMAAARPKVFERSGGCHRKIHTMSREERADV